MNKRDVDYKYDMSEAMRNLKMRLLIGFVAVDIALLSAVVLMTTAFPDAVFVAGLFVLLIPMQISVYLESKSVLRKNYEDGTEQS